MQLNNTVVPLNEPHLGSRLVKLVTPTDLGGQDEGSMPLNGQRELGHVVECACCIAAMQQDCDAAETPVVGRRVAVVRSKHAEPHAGMRWGIPLRYLHASQTRPRVDPRQQTPSTYAHLWIGRGQPGAHPVLCVVECRLAKPGQKERCVSL